MTLVTKRICSLPRVMQSYLNKKYSEKTEGFFKLQFIAIRHNEKSLVKYLLEKCFPTLLMLEPAHTSISCHIHHRLKKAINITPSHTASTTMA